MEGDRHRYFDRPTGIIPGLILLGLFMPVWGQTTQSQPTSTQSRRMVQEIVGHLDLEDEAIYELPNLKADETLYVYAKGTSGNLDPFVAVLKPGVDLEKLDDVYLEEIERGIKAGKDPLAIMPKMLKKVTLAWDEDSGDGYDAALEFVIPVDGDYQLIVVSSLSYSTFGDYQLWIGLNEPAILTAQAESTGDVLGQLNPRAERPGRSVEEVVGEISEDKPETFYKLDVLYPGETLYVFIEALSGNLKPIVTLSDFGNKPLISDNSLGQKKNAEFKYVFPHRAKDYQLKIQGYQDDEILTTGKFRLLTGINAPKVLTGKAKPSGQPVLDKPTPVHIGIKMQQITEVNQKAEHYGVVGTFGMEWFDPALAFSPGKCLCEFQILTESKFRKYAAANGTLWPEFTFYNQQGKRWSQNRLFVVFPDGRTLYFERFSATLQAPDFDFRKFPFDTQDFFIRVDALLPEEYFTFTPMEGFNEIGTQLGEEEWVVNHFNTRVTHEIASTRQITSRFAFQFSAHRHLDYYVFRIFVPLFIIIVVSWLTFFLDDYGKRVDVAGANLLIFIAFNFTISNDLPRLGYLTILDIVLVSAFIITGLVLILTVYMRRLQAGGREKMADRIDQFMIWIYPIAYLVTIISVICYYYIG